MVAPYPWVWLMGGFWLFDICFCVRLLGEERWNVQQCIWEEWGIRMRNMYHMMITVENIQTYTWSPGARYPIDMKTANWMSQETIMDASISTFWIICLQKRWTEWCFETRSFVRITWNNRSSWLFWWPRLRWLANHLCQVQAFSNDHPLPHHQTFVCSTQVACRWIRWLLSRTTP